MLSLEVYITGYGFLQSVDRSNSLGALGYLLNLR